MTHGLLQRSLACLLVLCLLVIGGLAAAQSLPHETQHSHHQKSTHGTVLCSWMCAAGQAGEATSLFVSSDAAPRDFVEVASAAHVPAVFSDLFATRGPPTH